MVYTKLLQLKIIYYQIKNYYRRIARNQEAYAIKLIINKKTIEKCVSNSKLSMNDKLEKAIELLNEIKLLYKIENPQV